MTVCNGPDPEADAGVPVNDGWEATRAWGEHPAHSTCLDITRMDQMPGSEWICGPDCPRSTEEGKETVMTLGYQTNPGRVGAPLPGEMAGIRPPAPGAILAELARAKVELMYAIARHRQAWASMRQYAETQALKQGPQAYLDSDPTWKVKTGDVTWWRGEMAAQAAAVTALMAMAEG